MSQLQTHDVTQPVTVINVRGEDFVFVRVRDLQPLPPVQLSPQPCQTVYARGSMEMIKITLWIACAIAGLFLLISILRSPASPSAQPVVINNPPEKKRHTSRNCNPAGFLGWNEVCSEKEWWE